MDAILYRKTYGEKAYREYCKSKRVMIGFNTGERMIRSKKDYNRSIQKRKLRKYQEE